MGQICPILSDNWETEDHTEAVPFQNSFGMAKNDKIPVKKSVFFNDAPLTGLFSVSVVEGPTYIRLLFNLTSL